jgi:sugar phosphate permease
VRRLIKYVDEFQKYRWIIFSILSVGYIFVHIHRVSTAIIAKELIKTFGISGSSLGILASAYFYPYAITQLPMGLLSDSLGPRKTVTVFLLIGCLSTVLFGLSPSFSLAIFARVLIGFSAAALFIPTMKILAEWYRTSEFATVGGILMAIGAAGWLLATTPLALLINWLGWRLVFVMMGIATLILAILTWTSVRNRPDEMGWPGISDAPATSAKAEIGLAEGVKIVLREEYFWPLAIRFFCSYATVMAFGGLWGGSYLTEIYGLTKAQAGNVLMMMPTGVIVGSPFLGWVSDRVLFARKPVLVGGTFIYFLVWVPLTFWTGRLSIPLLYFLSFLIGVFGTGIFIVALAAQKELFPEGITGTSIGLLNILPFGGAALFLPITGYIMDRVGMVAGTYPVDAYKEVFLLCFVLAGISLFGVCFMKETLCNELSMKG